MNRIGKFLDKNGKEICNGDIVSIGNKILEVKLVQGFLYTPYISPSGNISNYRVSGWRKDKIEVIGNIYENPELIYQPKKLTK